MGMTKKKALKELVRLAYLWETRANRLGPKGPESQDLVYLVEALRIAIAALETGIDGEELEKRLLADLAEVPSYCDGFNEVFDDYHHGYAVAIEDIIAIVQEMRGK